VSVQHPAFAPLDAPTLVEASAGTGKTYTITTYFVRAIVEKGYSPKQILVVTYTRAATSELRARARERIMDALVRLDDGREEPDALDEILAKATASLGRDEVEKRLRTALGSMDQAAILTIHGFCQRLLQDHPLSFGIDFEFEVAEDLGGLLAELATDFWVADLYEQPEWLVRALSDRRIKTKQLIELARAAAMPGVSVIGPAPADLQDAAIERVLESQRHARALWLEHRADVATILREDKGLSRVSYGKSSVEKWIRELDAYFEEDGLGALPEWMSKLVQGEMKVKKGFEQPQHPFFEACGALLGAHQTWTPILDYAVFDFKRRFLAYVEAQTERRRRETGVLSFDDLLTTVYRCVTSDEPSRSESVAAVIAGDYPLALIDEFQDTDSIQYGIFKSVYGQGAAVYVGDPKQAIYAFRGADVFSYIAAAKDVGERRHTLDTNRRSDPSMVRAVNLLFENRKPPFVLSDIEFEGARAHHREDRASLRPAMEVLFIDEAELKRDAISTLASTTANEVAHLLRSNTTIEDRPIEPGDVAVLCRSNPKARAVTKALRALNVPTSLDADSSVLETEIAESLGAVLEAALMPGDSWSVRRALLTPLLGVSARELASMNDQVWTEWVSRFRQWHDTWRSQGVVRFIEDMLRTSGAEQRIASSRTARRELTDLLQMEELLMRGERERQRDPVALMQWYRRLEEGGAEDGMVRSEHLQQRPDAESGAVRVTTIHKSKGLEYGFVYCPFNWGDASLWTSERSVLKFHDDEDGSIRIDVGSAARDTHEKQAEEEKLSEALRVLYVAVTRAKYRCTLLWGRAKGCDQSALGYLLDGKERSSKPTQEQLRAEVESLVERSGGMIGCREPEAELAQPFEEASSEAELEARDETRTFDLAPRIASFTSLTGHDEKTPGPRKSTSEEELRSRMFASLPGGTRTGLLLHSILERVSFSALESDEVKSEIDRQLSAYGFGLSFTESLQRDLVTMGATPLFSEPDSPGLANLRPDRQLRELEFTLSASRPRLDELAKLLREHGAPSAAPGYAERLSDLHNRSLQAFLRGYIDLMFEWNGRWYVADYKSNTLPSYDAPDVNEAAQREHYVLQALLYSAAAQRYLHQRVLNYDPATQWGGALLLFLRGMRGPDSGVGSVFFDRQSPALLAALDRWIGGDDEHR